jgi:hypothetical protein
MPEPKRTNYAILAAAAAFVASTMGIPCTMFGVKVMEIEEVPVQSGVDQAALALQGLQYQIWDPSPIATEGVEGPGLGAWGPTMQAPPGTIIVLGDGFSVIGNNAQPTNWAGTRAADVPIQIMSGTGTATNVQVREYTRKIST